MTDILALDIASTTGWARGRPGEEPRCGSVRFGKPGASELAIIGHAMAWAIDTIKTPLPDMVAIEALLPPLVTRGQTNEGHDLLAKLHGAIMGVCFNRGVYKVRSYPVQSIRAHFIDLGTCAKGEAKQVVLQRCRSLGWLESADDDAADACALWSYQVGLIDPEQAIRISPLFAKTRAGRAALMSVK